MDLTGIASIITALAVLVTALTSLRSQRKTAAKVAVVDEKVTVVDEKVDAVHDEVRTANGITIAALADRAEGRRVHEEIPHGDRTTSEQGYVDMLGAGGRDMGHDGRSGDETTADIEKAGHPDGAPEAKPKSKRRPRKKPAPKEETP